MIICHDDFRLSTRRSSVMRRPTKKFIPKTTQKFEAGLALPERKPEHNPVQSLQHDSQLKPPQESLPPLFTTEHGESWAFPECETRTYRAPQQVSCASAIGSTQSRCH